MQNCSTFLNAIIFQCSQNGADQTTEIRGSKDLLWGRKYRFQIGDVFHHIPAGLSCPLFWIGCLWLQEYYTSLTLAEIGIGIYLKVGGLQRWFDSVTQ